MGACLELQSESMAIMVGNMVAGSHIAAQVAEITYDSKSWGINTGPGVSFWNLKI